jgi:serine/threonine protein kinase
MPLTPGTKLGPYEIQSQLGAGGMGEVYRARDTRLDRDVAIKVLLTNLSSDPSLKQRLEREAKAVSKLSHPHICTLHDIGQQDGIDFLEAVTPGCQFARLERCRDTSQVELEAAMPGSFFFKKHVEVLPRHSIIGLQTDRFAACRDGAIDVPLLVKRAPEVVVRHCGVRL